MGNIGGHLNITLGGGTASSRKAGTALVKWNLPMLVPVGHGRFKNLK
jgi:hypothetical protein